MSDNAQNRGFRRRDFLVGGGVLVVGGSGLFYFLTPSGEPNKENKTESKRIEVSDKDHVLGNPEAPNLIVEYASLTCGHCRSFHQNSFPELKKDWIDTGKARFVYRHFPLDSIALDAALAAECFEGQAFFGFIKMLFENQRKWSRAEDHVSAIAELSKMGGLTEKRIQKCVSDEVERNRIIQEQKAASEKFGISSTPSFVVNGEVGVGNVGVDGLSRLMTT